MKADMLIIGNSKIRQRGAVLIVALVLLLILTILGTAGIQNTLLTERMSGNYRDVAVAFESAEAALRSGEKLLLDTSTFDSFLWDGSDGSWTVSDTEKSISPSTNSNYAISTGATEVPPDASAVSAYYLEKMLQTKKPPGGSLVQGFEASELSPYYRITGKGVGVSPNVEVILQSTYYLGK